MFFYLLAKFKKLANIKGNISFIKEAKATAPAAASFDIELTKEHLQLKNFVDSDQLHVLSLHMVYIDTKRNVLFASNGRKAIEIAVNISNFETTLPENKIVCISIDMLKNCQGSTKIEYFEEEYNNRTIATSAAGVSYAVEYTKKTCNYTSILIDVYKQGYFCIDSADIKNVIKFIKANKKAGEIRRVTFKTYAGSNKLDLVCEHEETNTRREISVNLSKPAKIFINFAISANDIYNVLDSWTGGIWYRASDYMFVFDSSIGSYILIMPARVDEPGARVELKNAIKLLKRNQAPAAPVAPLHPDITDQPAAVASVVQPYADSQKSQIFPGAHQAQRKYFFQLEKFLQAAAINYSFEVAGRKIRLTTVIAGITALFDYDIISRHRDVYLAKDPAAKRQKLQNWTAAINHIRGHLVTNQPAAA